MDEDHQMRFHTILVDPPWSYDRSSRHEKLTGYADKQYQVLDTETLAALPVGELADDSSVLLLWTTWPFFPDALKLTEAWGFEYKTALAWVKTAKNDETCQKVAYGVGYWMRGAVEPCLLAKRGNSYRGSYVGLLSPTLGHSRKPESIYEFAEQYPTPRLELFARGQPRPGWYALGNECDGDGLDIRTRLAHLEAMPSTWEAHLG